MARRWPASSDGGLPSLPGLSPAANAVSGSNCSVSTKLPRRSRFHGALDQRARQTQRGAAQRERILVAARLHSGGENAGERVESFGDREHLAELAGRNRVTGRNGAGSTLSRASATSAGSPSARGVVAPHRALQFGEFVDHARQQIAFAQGGSAGRRSRIGTDAIGDDRAPARPRARVLSHRLPSDCW